MAKEYTVKVFGKKTKYRKIGSKYYRFNKDGFPGGYILQFYISPIYVAKISL